MKNLIQLLDQEHENNGFRYFFLKSTGRPSIDYLSEGVKELMSVVSDHLKNSLLEADTHAAVLKFTFDKPILK